MEDTKNLDSGQEFCITEYRKNNVDLRNLSDRELEEHYIKYGREERRIFRKPGDIREQMSMAWLRGKGLEIGAATNPTPLYGKKTACSYLEPDVSDAEDSAHTLGVVKNKDFEGIRYWGNIEEKSISKKIPGYGSFDFCIALHVLEHANSLIRAIKNTIEATKEEGIVYLALPDKNYLEDKIFMKRYGIFHHSIEYMVPKFFRREHHRRFCNGLGPESYKRILEKDIYMHRHTYDMDGYSSLFARIKDISVFFGFSFEIKDIAYGHERKDINIILENKCGKTI